MLEDDGDIIKALGFVTLNAAYLEEQIDDLLFLLDAIEKFTNDKQKYFIREKIRLAKRNINKLSKSDFQNLILDLDECFELFERRNELIHGRIYGSFDRPDTLRSGRIGVPDREIVSEELYNLANEFDEMRLRIYRPTIVELPRKINDFLVHRRACK